MSEQIDALINLKLKYLRLITTKQDELNALKSKVTMLDEFILESNGVEVTRSQDSFAAIVQKPPLQ